MNDERFAASKEPGGAHHRLATLVGQWQGTIKTWIEPQKPSDESSISGSMRAVLDGRFILHEYETAFAGKPVAGIAMYGYHLDRQRFESVWVDSFGMGTGIMFSESERKPARLALLGSYGEGADRYGWRTEIHLDDPDHLTLTAYNIAPRGLLMKANEVQYVRVPSA
jgi:hypothetical protein